MPSFAHPPTAVGTSPFRIHLTYLWRHRRLARLQAPRLFTEWVQHRKLHDRDARLPQLADKVTAKELVKQCLGPEWITPTLWCGTRLPPEPEWPFPYVVKSRHGCGHTAIVRDPEDHRAAVLLSRRWMKASYGAWLDEWLYGEINRGLLVEPFIGEGSDSPIDYKLFVFGGRAQFVQVHLGRSSDQHRWIVFNRHWQRVSPASSDPDPAPPPSLAAMLDAAERLGAGFSFVRADFYDVAGEPRFGELTFYPGSGLVPVEPPRLDLLMGLLWSAALPGWLGPSAPILG